MILPGWLPETRADTRSAPTEIRRYSGHFRTLSQHCEKVVLEDRVRVYSFTNCQTCQPSTIMISSVTMAKVTHQGQMASITQIST